MKQKIDTLSLNASRVEGFPLHQIVFLKFERRWKSILFSGWNRKRRNSSKICGNGKISARYIWSGSSIFLPEKTEEMEKREQEGHPLLQKTCAYSSAIFRHGCCFL